MDLCEYMKQANEQVEPAQEEDEKAVPAVKELQVSSVEESKSKEKKPSAEK